MEVSAIFVERMHFRQPFGAGWNTLFCWFCGIEAKRGQTRTCMAENMSLHVQYRLRHQHENIRVSYPAEAATRMK